MTLDLNSITLDHVYQACEMFDAGRAVPKRLVHGFLLLLDGKRYPAQFIFRLSWHLAAGAEVSNGQHKPSRSAAITFFKRVGLPTEHGTLQLIRQPGESRVPARKDGTNGRKKS